MGENPAITSKDYLSQKLYEKTAEYLRDKGYVVRKFDLVTPQSSDSWNCLAEIEGQELMAQLMCDVIIRNTGSEKSDHFWDNSEMNCASVATM